MAAGVARALLLELILEKGLEMFAGKRSAAGRACFENLLFDSACGRQQGETRGRGAAA